MLRLLSALLPPSYWALLLGHLWLSAVQLPQFWSITPSTSMILMNPQAFYCQSIIEQPLKELFPQLFEGAQGWLSLPSKLKCTAESFAMTEYSCSYWSGCRSKRTHALFCGLGGLSFFLCFFFCLFWHLFRALIHKICFWAARDIQKHSEYMVSAVSIWSSFSPHLHL